MEETHKICFFLKFEYLSEAYPHLLVLQTMLGTLRLALLLMLLYLLFMAIENQVLQRSMNIGGNIPDFHLTTGFVCGFSFHVNSPS